MDCLRTERFLNWRVSEKYLAYRKIEAASMLGLLESNRAWFYNPQRHWANLQSAPEVGDQTIVYLEGKDPRIEEERSLVRQALEGFRMGTIRYDGEFLGNRMNRKRHILSHLDAGRPVAVSMNIGGMKSWNRRDTPNDYHGFLIVGYRDTKKGLEFVTRNSWGGKNPVVSEKEIYRISAISFLFIPGEISGEKWAPSLELRKRLKGLDVGHGEPVARHQKKAQP